MRLNKWVYNINELFDFYINNFKEYTLFLKGNLCIRDDGEYVCGTCVVTNNDYDKELRQRLKVLHKNSIFLITDIDIKDKHIVFNEIGSGLEREIIGYQQMYFDKVMIINKAIECINKMIFTGYSEGIMSYMATSENSEFGERAKILLKILKGDK